MCEDIRKHEMEGRAGSGSRRRRLWDLPHKCHCPVIGVCFDAAQLPGLLARAGQPARGLTQHKLHVRAVGECETRMGKQCIFLKSPGITSFAKGVAQVAETDPAALQPAT